MRTKTDMLKDISKNLNEINHILNNYEINALSYKEIKEINYNVIRLWVILSSNKNLNKQMW